MVENIIALLTHFITSFIQSSGYFGIFVLMTAESALIPIPSEITMPFAGYIVSLGHFNFWLVVLVGTVANLAGSLLAYALGYLGEDAVVRNVIRKYGKYVLISESEYSHSEVWFRKYGQNIVFFSRILPIVRTFISLPAGVARMNIMRFTVFTLIGSFIWSAILTYVGLTLGKNWHSLEGIYRKFEYVIVFLIIAAVAYYIYHKLSKLKQK